MQTFDINVRYLASSQRFLLSSQFVAMSTQLGCNGAADVVDVVSVVGVGEGVAVVGVVGEVAVVCVAAVGSVVGVVSVVPVVGVVGVEGEVTVLLVVSSSSNPRNDLHCLQLFKGATHDDAAGHASRTGQDLSAEGSKFSPVLIRSGIDVGIPVECRQTSREQSASRRFT